jgi:prohibitin 1
MFVVPPGHRGLIYDWKDGVRDEVKDEGTHFRIPGLQTPILMDTRLQPRSISTTTGTMDMQTVRVSLRVLVKPRISELASIYKRTGSDYLERTLPSLVPQVLKDEFARYNADQLMVKRDIISSEIKSSLVAQANEYNIEIDDVSITQLSFAPEYAKAVENKQVAEQMAERAKYVVMMAEEEKLARVIKSEGDATAAKMVGDALIQCGDGLLQMRKIETAVEIAETLARKRDVTYLPSQSGGGSMLLNLKVD